MPPIPVIATATFSSFETESTIVVREPNSLCRPSNLLLLFNPGPSKNFLSTGKGQLEDVGEGSQGLYKNTVSKHMMHSNKRCKDLNSTGKKDVSLYLGVRN
jgi:hypothetical protein